MIEKIKEIERRWSLDKDDCSFEFYYSEDFQTYACYQLWVMETNYILASFAHDECELKIAKNNFVNFVKQFCENDNYFKISTKNKKISVPVSYELHNMIEHIRSEYDDVIKS